jgi:hypothetical protein
MNARRFALTAFAVAAAALAGCAMHNASAPGVTHLTAELTAAQEVPANPSPGRGHADVEYDRNTGMLRWTVSYSGLTGPATAAHIHGPAAAGANAGVVVPFTMSPSPMKGEKAITPTQAGDLMAGLWYVNVHTQAHPGGEIRGQLMIRR